MSAPKSADGRTPAEPHPRPLDVCRALLEALDATEGRRRRRKRNTGADAIGIGMKRALLEGAIRDDPDPAEFEGWLLERCFEQGPGEGAWRAMALEIFGEWRMAAAAPSFAEWLRAGAPSDDKPGAGRPERPNRAEGPARLPVFPGFAPVLAALALVGAACEGGIEADVDDVPEIEVEEASTEARQQGGVVAEVLGPLLAGPGPDSTVYDPPLPLARPAGATSWPPPTGTHGDAAARGIRPDTAPVMPDTVGAESGRNNRPISRSGPGRIPSGGVGFVVSDQGLVSQQSRRSAGVLRPSSPDLCRSSSGQIGEMTIPRWTRSPPRATRHSGTSATSGDLGVPATDARRHGIGTESGECRPAPGGFGLRSAVAGSAS